MGISTSLEDRAKRSLQTSIRKLIGDGHVACWDGQVWLTRQKKRTPETGQGGNQHEHPLTGRSCLLAIRPRAMFVNVGVVKNVR